MIDHARLGAKAARCIAAAALLAVAMGAQAQRGASGRVLIASDSTAAKYNADQFPQMGWGMFLGCSLAAGTEVVNLARGGRSTRTFIQEGLWGSLVDTLKAGDTVLIQFGHNDEDTSKPHRHTQADGEYADNLRRLVADVRARRATPVLVTPVARADFADGRIKETHGAYAVAVKRVAAETGAPLIDLNAASMAFLDGKGETAAAGYFMIYKPGTSIRFPEGKRDTTHLNELGARATAAIVARELRELKLPLSRSVRPADPDAATALGTAACR